MRSSRPPRPSSSESDRTPASSEARRGVLAAGRRYDEIVIDPCHDRWASFLHELWSADPVGVRYVLDLCCGTGLLAGELVARGTGSSASTIRRDAGPRSRAPWHRGGAEPDDASDLAVDGVFDAAVCTFDGLDYLTPAELRLTMAAVALRLRPGGWLVFDLHTDGMMSFTISNPVVAGESADNDFVIGSTVDPVPAPATPRSRSRGLATATRSASSTASTSTQMRMSRLSASRGLRSERGRRRVHARARGRVDPARDLDCTASTGLSFCPRRCDPRESPRGGWSSRLWMTRLPTPFSLEISRSSGAPMAGRTTTRSMRCGWLRLRVAGHSSGSSCSGRS